METKQEILHKYRVERKSLRTISRETGLNRKTVTRIVRDGRTYNVLGTEVE